MNVETLYRCSKCKAPDRDRGFAGQPAPYALNCWKCGAGRGLSLEEQISRNVGMVVVAQGPTS